MPSGPELLRRLEWRSMELPANFPAAEIPSSDVQAVAAAWSRTPVAIPDRFYDALADNVLERDRASLDPDGVRNRATRFPPHS